MVYCDNLRSYFVSKMLRGQIETERQTNIRTVPNSAVSPRLEISLLLSSHNYLIIVISNPDVACSKIATSNYTNVHQFQLDQISWTALLKSGYVLLRTLP